MSKYPKVKNPSLVGEYPAAVKAGGGYVWDEVLEYRVWCHPHDGAPDIEDGDDYYYYFETYEEALEFSVNNKGCESDKKAQYAAQCSISAEFFRNKKSQAPEKQSRQYENDNSCSK